MWLWFLGFILTIALIIFSIFKYLIGNKDYWTKQNIYYLDLNKMIPFWDRLTFRKPLHLTENAMYEGFISAGINTFGGIITFRSPSLVIMDLDLIKYITIKDFDHFINRRTFNMKKTDPLFHNMLINKENQEWKDLRSTMSPTFTTGKIKKMFEIFNESGNKLTNYLEQETYKNNNNNAVNVNGIDFKDVIIKYTMDVIASSAFGIDIDIFNNNNSLFLKYGKKLQNQFNGWKIIKIILAMFIPKLLQTLNISITDVEAIRFFTNVIQETIKKREESNEKRNDFIQLLIDAKSVELNNDDNDDEGEGDNNIIKLEMNEKDVQLKKTTPNKIPLTNQLILSQALLFFSAGFDTTETFLSFAIYEMAINQDIQQQLYEEIYNTMDKNDGKLNYEMINHMEYLDKVVSETLRKYPPAIRIERKCTQDYKIPNSNIILKKDDIVIIPLYGIHHDKKYYPNPDKFDPERFSIENKSKRHPYAYMPFGTGPRNCIAMRFALMEGKSALAHVIYKFKIEPSQKTNIPIKFVSSASFKPDSLWLKVTKRE